MQADKLKWYCMDNRLHDKLHKWTIISQGHLQLYGCFEVYFVCSGAHVYEGSATII